MSSPGGPDVAAFSQTVSFGPNVSSQAVTIPIINDGRAGESDVDIPIALSSAGTGATLGSIHIDSPGDPRQQPVPAPCHRRVGAGETIKVKVGKGKKAKTKSETALEIQFSGLVAGSGDLAAYQLSSVTTKKVKKKVVTSYKPIRLTSALPASIAHGVVGFALARNEAKPLADRSTPDRRGRPHRRLGRPLDGNDDGLPGGNYVAIVTKQARCQPPSQPRPP